MSSRILLASLLTGAALLGALAGAALWSSGAPAEPQPAADAPAAAAAAKVDQDVPSGRRASPTEGTARDAALAYASASQQWLYLEDEAIEAAIREVTTDGAADRLVRQTVSEIGVAREALVHAAGPVWWFVRPLATRVTVGEGRAAASVWIVTVLSAPGVALPQADWLTLDLELVWRDGRWLLESIEDRPGPTPTSGVRDDPWQPELFAEALSGFERLGSEVAQ